MAMDSEKVVRVECLCGNVFEGKQPEVRQKYEKCVLGHNLPHGAWNEAYLRIEAGRERAKNARGAEKE